MSRWYQAGCVSLRHYVLGEHTSKYVYKYAYTYMYIHVCTICHVCAYIYIHACIHSFQLSRWPLYCRDNFTNTYDSAVQHAGIEAVDKCLAAPTYMYNVLRVHVRAYLRLTKESIV